jgi:hypothetical protein
MQYLLYRKVAALLEPQETYAELVNSFQVWRATCDVEILIYSWQLIPEIRCTLLRYAAPMTLHPSEYKVQFTL